MISRSVVLLPLMLAILMGIAFAYTVDYLPDQIATIKDGPTTIATIRLLNQVEDGLLKDCDILTCKLRLEITPSSNYTMQNIMVGKITASAREKTELSGYSVLQDGEWEPMPAEFLAQAGRTYVVGIDYVRSDVNDSADLVPSFFGEDLDAWAWWNASWNYSIPIILNNTWANAESLTNFPARVRLPTSNSTLWNTTTCTNVRFVDVTNSTILPYDLDSANATFCGNATNNAIFYISVNLTANTTTKIFAYLGNTGAPSGEQQQTVWQLGNYISVYHAYDGGAWMLDATGRNNVSNQPTYGGDCSRVSVINGMPTRSVNGKASATGCVLVNKSLIGMPANLSDISISLWAKIIVDGGTVLSLSYSDGRGANFYGNGTHIHFNDGNTYQNGVSGYGNNLDFFALTYNNATGTRRVFHNASYNTDATAQKFPSSSYSWLAIGSVNPVGGYESYGVQGNISEIRIRNATSTRGWLWAEWNLGQTLEEATFYGGVISVNLTSPTPPNGAVRNESWIYVNASIARADTCDLYLNSDVFAMTVSPDFSYCYLNKTGLPDGNYSYYVRAGNSTSLFYIDSETRTIVLDTEIPKNVSFISAQQNSTFFYHNISFNLSFTETNPTNCWFFINNTNISVAPKFSSCVYDLNDTVGNMSVVGYVKDAFNTTVQTNNYTFYGFDILNVQYGFSNPQNELSNDVLFLNITTYNFFDNVYPSLEYNGTVYTPTTFNHSTNLRQFYATVVPPIIYDNTTIHFVWSINWNGTVFTSFNNSTTLIPLNLSICTIANGTVLYRFDFYDQDDTSKTVDSTMDATFSILGSSGQVKNFSFNFSTPTPTALICVNQTAGNYTISSIQQYRAPNYRPLYYYILRQNAQIPIQYNISLYNLNMSISYATRYQVYQGANLPVSNAYIQILRYYPSTNQLLLVSMAKTDQNGIAESYAIPNDINYRYVILDSTPNILFTSGLAPLPCDPMSSLCTTIISISSAVRNEYSSFVGNTAVGCAVNFSSNLVYCTSTDPSGTGTSIRLRLWRMDTYENVLICDNIVNSSSGTAVCTFPDPTRAYYYVGTADIGSIIILGQGSFQNGVLGTCIGTNCGTASERVYLFGDYGGRIAAIALVVIFAGIGMLGGFSASIIMACIGMIISVLVGFIDIGLVYLGGIVAIGLTLAYVLRV